MNVILPNTYLENHEIVWPLFFLAGPDAGGGNWREKCCDFLAQMIEGQRFSVVVPCRWVCGHKYWQNQVFATSRRMLFYRQCDWEYYYLQLVANQSDQRRSCTMFWLPEESKVSPNNGDQPYACNTLGELGRWGKNAALTGALIVVGGESGFPSLGTIKRNLDLDFKQDFPVWGTLEETTRKAVCAVNY